MTDQTNIIHGHPHAQTVYTELTKKIAYFTAKIGRAPTLRTILVGQDPASHTYVNRKLNQATKLGIDASCKIFDEDFTEADLLAYLHKLNHNNKTDGILVQLPLPTHINTQHIIKQINPLKDVDGFHPINVGALATGLSTGIKPCTPQGCVHLLTAMVGGDVANLKGLNVVVIGRSNIVGKPLSLMLGSLDCTVTTCHRYTKNLPFHCQQADAIIVATGQPHLIQPDWIPDHAHVIDVGCTRLDNGTWAGDVHFTPPHKCGQSITPVPGGVGPMTIAYLMKNVVDCAYNMHIID
jgi:methylenetetrahydrofolate dehydrogenase (NADP+)/methenyltetrahydrofolate cyclohydrolase